MPPLTAAVKGITFHYVRLQQLRCFDAVARQGSVRRAAQELLLTAPSVSEQITAFETEVGVALLERDTRGARWGASGAHLLPHLQGVLNAALVFAGEVGKSLERDYVAYGQIKDVGEQLGKLGDGAGGKPVQDAIGNYESAIGPLQSGAGADSENLGDIGGVLSSIAADLEGSDRAPTQPQRDVVAAADARLDRALKHWGGVQKNELAALNAALKAAGKAEIRVPAADQVRLRDAPESKDLP